METTFAMRRRELTKRRPIWGWLYQVLLFGLLCGAFYQLIQRHLPIRSGIQASAARLLR